MSETPNLEVELQTSTRDFLAAAPKQLLINGEWVSPAAGQTFFTRNPATGEVLAEVSLAGEIDVDRAVQSARAAYQTGPWSKMSGDDRGRLLWKLADLVDAHADELAEIETLDNGKPIRVLAGAISLKPANISDIMPAGQVRLKARLCPSQSPTSLSIPLESPSGL